MLGSIFFLKHFYALYIRKLQLKKIYDIYDTIDNNNRTNRYVKYIKYEINNNNDKYTKNIINNKYVPFDRYGIFGIYVIFDRSVSFCRFQFPSLNFGLWTKSTLLLPLKVGNYSFSLSIFQEDLSIGSVEFALVLKIQI